MLKFADAMTIAAKLGGPHLFTTFSTSPTWSGFHDSSSNTPYVEDNMVDEDRVFKEKLALFLDDLRKGVFFEKRKAAYIISVVEFQWRGHPHAHIVYRVSQVNGR
jgi:Helitron helicase-like domain at N-terminus